VFQPRLSVDHTFDDEGGFGRLPFRVGGLFNLSGLPSDQFFGSNAFVGALIVRQRLGGGEGKSGVFVGGSIEAGNVWDDNDRYLPDDWIIAGSAFVAASTPLGPVHLALDLAEKGSPTFYFYLGQVIP
jgi:NTE family protein